jgi:hypothetical protein
VVADEDEGRVEDLGSALFDRQAAAWPERPIGQSER